jgi:hypothetical protein
MSDSEKIAEWEAKINAIRAFAETHKRWPSSIAEDENEKALGAWWSRSRYYAQLETPGEPAGGIDPRKAARVRELVLQFPLFDRDGQWKTKFRQVELRILSARNIWSKRHATPEQAKLIQWWNQQKTQLKKFRLGQPSAGMDEERAQLIEDLMKFSRSYKGKHLPF